MNSTNNTLLKNHSETELISRLKAGDSKALEIIMRGYNQSLYRAARSILKNEEEAEEAVQDAYLKAYRAIGNFHGNAKLSTWLTRIAINEALARRRKIKRRGEIIQFDGDITLTAATEEGSHMSQNITTTPEQNAQCIETRRMIERYIDQLPDAFRSVFVLRALEEMTVEETANCLDIPEATVRSRYFRARARMREAIAREIDLNYESAFSFAGERCDRIVTAVLKRLSADSNTPKKP